MSTHLIDLHVGHRLRTIRLMRSMTQEELGKAVKLTTQQIQKYEKGHNRVSASKLYEFSIVLNISILYFFSEIKDEHTIIKDILNECSKRNGHTNNTELNEPPTKLQDKEYIAYDRMTSSLVASFMSIKEESVKKKIIQLIRAISHTDDNYIEV